MRKAITALLGSSILFTSGAALAQYQTGGQYQTGAGGTYQPGYTRPSTTDNIGGTDAQFVFGVERVTGVFWNRLQLEDDNVTETSTGTDIALFGNGVLPNPHTMPRLGLDYFVIEGFSLGGSLVYWRTSGETENETAAASNTSDDPTISQFLIHPRVGYSFVIDETFAVWPRAGITYGNVKIENTQPNPTGTGTVDTTESTSTLALSLDVPVVISPIENFAILIGPFVDFGVSGTQTRESDPGGSAPDRDAKLTSIGLSMGIAGYY
jgi:opacity protein-like surface antigen